MHCFKIQLKEKSHCSMEIKEFNSHSGQGRRRFCSHKCMINRVILIDFKICLKLRIKWLFVWFDGQIDH